MSSSPDAVFALLEQIHKEQQELNASVSSLNTEFQKHIAEEEVMLERHTAEIVALQAAFPRGDVAGHQMYHSSIIKRNEFLADVFKEAAKHIAKYGLLAFVIWVFGHAVVDLGNKFLEALHK